MSNDEDQQWPTAESTGIDKGYEKEREQANSQLRNQMAGPKEPLAPEGDVGIKNPDGEFERPAPFVSSRSDLSANSADSADTATDPKGQQGGTMGGRPAKPSLPNEFHPLSK